jgi:hypothetical protein
MKRKSGAFLLEEENDAPLSGVEEEQDVPLGEIVEIASRSSIPPPKEKEEEDSLSPTLSEEGDEEEDARKVPLPRKTVTTAPPQHRQPPPPPVTAEEITRELWESMGQDPDDIIIMDDGKSFKCKRCHSLKSRRMPLKGTYAAMYEHCRTFKHTGKVGHGRRQCDDDDDEEDDGNKKEHEEEGNEEEQIAAIRLKQSKKYAKWPLERMKANARKFWVDMFDQLPTHYELQYDGTYIKCLICGGLRHGCWNDSSCVRAHVRTRIHRDALARLLKCPNLPSFLTKGAQKALAKAEELKDARHALERSTKQKRQKWEQPETLLEPRGKYSGSYEERGDDDEEDSKSVSDKEEEEMHVMVPADDEQQHVDKNKRYRDHDEPNGGGGENAPFVVPSVPLPAAASPINVKPADVDDALERRHRSHVLKRIKVDAEFRARVLRTMELKPEFHAKIMRMKDDEFEAELLSMDDGDTTGHPAKN